MRELYSKERLLRLRSAIKRSVLVAVCVFLFFFIICTTVCFFTDRTNATLLKIFNIVISGVGGCVVIYWVLNRILPLIARRDYMESLLFSAGRTVSGTVEDTGIVSTVSRYIYARELRLINDEGNAFLLYWDNEIPFPDLNDKRVELRIVHNRIVAYEVTK